MRETASGNPRRSPGRPRSEAARLAILEAAYTLMQTKGFHSVGSHEIAAAAGVSSATLYRWWNSREEILFDACFEHMKPVLAVSGEGAPLERLRRYVLRATEFLNSDDGAVMARVLTGIHDDPNLRRLFLERYVAPRRRIQSGIIAEAVAAGELEPATDPDLLIDLLNGPLFFRWLQAHAELNSTFTDRVFDSVISAFRPRSPNPSECNSGM